MERKTETDRKTETEREKETERRERRQIKRGEKNLKNRDGEG